MLITKKMLLALTLVGALVGAGVGALITHSSGGDTSAANTYGTTQAATQTAPNPNEKTPDQLAAENSSQFKTSEEQTAYRAGFDDGFTTCGNQAKTNSTNDPATYRTAPASYRTSSTRVVRRSANGRRVYYDYSNQPRGRTFWQKHRDKLTVAMGTGGGALLGGLIGGKKGAGIGALAGAGGSALYTYKIRKRTRRY